MSHHPSPWCPRRITGRRRRRPSGAWLAEQLEDRRLLNGASDNGVDAPPNDPSNPPAEIAPGDGEDRSDTHSTGEGVILEQESPAGGGDHTSSPDPTTAPDSSPVLTGVQIPADVVTGDFNGDGVPDRLVGAVGQTGGGTSAGSSAEDGATAQTEGGFNPIVTKRGDGSGVVLPGSGVVTISLSDGHGGFTAPVTIDVGPDATGLTVTDVNHDGHSDLLVGTASGTQFMLLGNGDGTFQPRQEVARSTVAAVADINGDGHGDSVFATQAPAQVSVAYGDAPAQPVPTGDSPGTPPASDAVASHGTPAQPTPTGDSPGTPPASDSVAVADLTDDGILDLIVADRVSDTVQVLPGLGDHQFGPALNGGTGFSVGTDPVGVTIADVNTDGVADVVVSNEGSNEVSVLVGQGQGVSYTLSAGPQLQVGLAPVGTVVQDVNGDSKPDIVVSDSGSNDVRVIPGFGDGSFDDRNATVIPVGDRPGAPLVGNFDTNPGLDLVSTNTQSNDLTVVSNFGGGAGTSRSIPSGRVSPVTSLAGDLNGDGLSDLITVGDPAPPAPSPGDITDSSPAPVPDTPDGLGPPAPVSVPASEDHVPSPVNSGDQDGATPQPFGPDSDPPEFDPATLTADAFDVGGFPFELDPRGIDPMDILGGVFGPDDGSSPLPVILPGSPLGPDAPEATLPGESAMLVRLLPLPNSASALVATLVSGIVSEPAPEAHATDVPNGRETLASFSAEPTAGSDRAAPDTDATPAGAESDGAERTGTPAHADRTQDQVTSPPAERGQATDVSTAATTPSTHAPEARQTLAAASAWARITTGLDEAFDHHVHDSLNDPLTAGGPPSQSTHLQAARDAVLAWWGGDTHPVWPGLARPLCRAATPTLRAIDAATNLMGSETESQTPATPEPALEMAGLEKPEDVGSERPTEMEPQEVLSISVSLVLIAALLTRRAWPLLRRRRGNRLALAVGSR
jgi:hypothetical protein